MKTISAKKYANPAFKQVQPLPMPAGLVRPEVAAWLAAAGQRDAGQMPRRSEFPLNPAGGSPGRLSSWRSPGDVPGASPALVISGWAGSGRLFT